MKREGRVEKPALVKIREPPHIAFISKHPFLKRITNSIVPKLEEKIPEAGVAVTPYRLAAEGVFLMLACIPVAVGGIILGLAINPVFLALVLLPPICLLIPDLRVRSMTGDRKRSLEEELPLFAIHAGICQSAGLDLYASLSSVIGRGIFKQIERDASMVRRNVEFFGQGPLEAVEEIGRTNPSRQARDFLLGYTSEWRSGGDATRYLELRAEDYFRDVEFRWKGYARRASDWGEMTVAFFFLLPLFVATLAFLSPDAVITFGGFFISVLIPGLAAAVLLSIHASRPKIYDDLGGDYRMAAAAGLGVAVLALASGMPWWLVLMFGLGGATAAYGASVYIQMREIAAVEGALPRFMRDITELRKMGHDLVRAITKASEDNEYNPTFDRLLAYVARQLAIGRRLSELDVPTRSWLARVSFFHLGMVAETGGGTPRTLELLTTYSGEWVRVKRETKQMMRLYRWLSVACPVILGVTLGLIVAIVSGFSAAFLAGAEPAILGELVMVSPVMVGFLSVTILAAAITLALLTAAATDFTVKNTLWITVNLAAAGVGIALASVISGAPFV